jgi:lactate dehydrogenase-like 2-hydroxyacid dehydrogenase
VSARPKVLLTRAWPKAVEVYLAGRCDLALNSSDRPLPPADLAAALGDYDAVCPTITDRIGSDILRAGLRTRALCNFGAGVDHIDLEACRELGIVVTNTPGVLTDDTADLTLLLALMAMRRAGEGERLVRAGDWPGWAPTHMLGRRLSGKTIGLIGFGRIGQAVARRAHHGFGMDVIYHARSRAAAEIEAASGARRLSFEEVLEAADVLSIHCPGGSETENLIDRAALARMKRGAILINTARGGIVDEAALCEALRRGTIAAAGLDVYRGEPAILPDLLALENVVLLPHLGSATMESRTAMGMRAAENLLAVLDGRDPPDRLV